MKSWNWLRGGLTWILLYLLGAFLFFWTASLTMAFVGVVLPNMPFAPYFALVMFDGGVLGWMYIFLGLARGTGQRLISITMLIVDFLGLAAIGIAEVFLGGQNIAAIPENLGNIAIWVLAIWTLINVAGFVAFHITDPNNLEKIQRQLAEDKIISMTLQKLGDKTDQISDQVADALAERQMRDVLARLSEKGDVDVLEVKQRPMLNSSNGHRNEKESFEEINP